MNKRTKQILIIGVFVAALWIVIVAVSPATRGFLAAQAVGIREAGTWEDDVLNWNRAFGEQPPADIKVIHSKYWRSDHFTVEFTYYFEVEPTPEWKDSFLKKHGLDYVSPAVARSFRADTHIDDTPDWFAPEPVDLYDVWDRPGCFGSVWINKTNGHLFFYNFQL